MILNPSPDILEKDIQICNTLERKSGPFGIKLFIGDLISQDDGDFPNTKTTAEQPIYFPEGIHNTSKVEKNSLGLKFLGQIGIKQDASGLKIGYITGNLQNLEVEDIKSQISTGLDSYVDILITYQWPMLISNEQKLTTVGSQKLDFALDLLKPRYWFAVGNGVGRFYERLPFQWEDGRVTRFISLAKHGSKNKWLYAFNISLNPVDDIKSVSQFGTKPQPIKKQLSQKRGRDTNDSRIDNHTNGREKRQRQVVTPDNCFFCLSNSKIELHMIVSIGKASYMTVAKGPLTYRTGPLGFSGHGLIIPIAHCATFLKYKENENLSCTVEETELYREMRMYQKSVSEMFSSLGNYATVFWEISRTHGVHFHTQFVPIPADLYGKFEETMKKQIDFASKKYGSKLSYIRLTNPAEDSKLLEVINSSDYMLITVRKSVQEITKYLFTLSDQDSRVDLQFPRKIVAFLLNLGKRIHWDRCKESISEETEQRDTFQKKFKPFDFTLVKK